MRFLFCKINCPLLCFCKPSSHIYTNGALKLESASQPHSLVPSAIVSDASSPLSSNNSDTAEVKGEEERIDRLVVGDGNGHANGKQPPRPPEVVFNGLKSSLKNKASLQSSTTNNDVHKKKVQWLDFLGKELAEVKEFECSEAGDADFESMNTRGCICSIL